MAIQHQGQLADRMIGRFQITSVGDNQVGYRYRRSRQDFYLFGSANEIRETEYGYTTNGNHILYPGISTCTAVTLILDDGSAAGMHLAKTDQAGDVAAIVAALNNHRGARNVTAMYAVGVLHYRSADGWMGQAQYGWPALLSTFNTDFGRASGDAVLGHKQAMETNYDYKVIISNGAGIWFSRQHNTESWNALALGTF